MLQYGGQQLGTLGVRPTGALGVSFLRRAVCAPRRALFAVAAGPAVVIAVDGPAAAGKGTLAKQLAAMFRLAHLDTGLLYRAVGWRALQQGVGLDDEAALERLSQQITPEDLSDAALRTDAAATAASRVSTLPRVRAALLEYQKHFAASPPGKAPGAVLDGRDIGTKICPDAPVKLFVTASAEVRARRRMHEFGPLGVSYEQVLQDLIERDERDRTRSAAPLVPASDAVILDTSDMSADEALAAALAVVTLRLPQLVPQGARTPAGVSA